ncbi:nadh dehydrogenase [Nannochloropsis oceanica]
MLPTTRWTSAPLSVQATTAAASYHKTATGPVGLEVNPNSRDDFIKQQKTLLEKVKKFPADAEYRKVITSIATYRLGKAEAITDPVALEKELDDGQLEEMLAQGEDELMLMDDYEERKYWETEEVKAAFRD